MSPVYVAIDFETSSNWGACACAVGMARLINGTVADTLYTLIRPPSSRVMFTHVHGLTWSMLKGARPFAAVWDSLAGFMEGADYLVAHNAGFDRHVLAACCEAGNLPMPRQPFLCTLRGARQNLKLKSNNLGAVAEYFNIPLQHHHAGSDALACGLILDALHRRGASDSGMLLPLSGQGRKVKNMGN